MDARAVDTFLARAAEATSVRDLHAAVRALRRAHPDDPDAERVERACWDRALELLARSAGVAPAAPAAAAVPGVVPAAVPAVVAVLPAAPRRDWKERAARMS